MITLVLTAALLAQPNVLLIGDSVSIAYTNPLREALEGQANLYRIIQEDGSNQNGRHTNNIKENLDDWLSWLPIDPSSISLTIFNAGLHDVRGQNPPQVDLSTYQDNLVNIAHRLRVATGGVVAFMTTTPIADSISGTNFNPSVVSYNAVAKTVMLPAYVNVIDLYEFIYPDHLACRPPGDGVHFTEEGSQRLATFLAPRVISLLAASMPSTSVPEWTEAPILPPVSRSGIIASVIKTGGIEEYLTSHLQRRLAFNCHPAAAAEIMDEFRETFERLFVLKPLAWQGSAERTYQVGLPEPVLRPGVNYGAVGLQSPVPISRVVIGIYNDSKVFLPYICEGSRVDLIVAEVRDTLLRLYQPGLTIQQRREKRKEKYGS